MNWSDIGRVIGGAAPVLGTLLGGPAGGAVGGLIAAALGTPSNPDAVNAALTNNPDAIVRIQELQVNARVQLEQLAVTAEMNRMQAEGAQYAAEAADRDSARKLAAVQPNDLIRPLIAAVLLLGSLFIIYSIMSGWAIDVITNSTAALTVGTVMGTWFMLTKEVMGFYFGTTKDSQKQSAAITDFAMTPGTVSAEKSNKQ